MENSCLIYSYSGNECLSPLQSREASDRTLGKDPSPLSCDLLEGEFRPRVPQCCWCAVHVLQGGRWLNSCVHSFPKMLTSSGVRKLKKAISGMRNHWNLITLPMTGFLRVRRFTRRSLWPLAPCCLSDWPFWKDSHHWANWGRILSLVLQTPHHPWSEAWQLPLTALPTD